MGQFESITEGFDNLDKINSLNMDLTLHGVCQKIKSRSIKKIVVLCGAGMSVSAGIPDFRSPDIGLYNNLDEYKLKEPEDLFDINFFKENPKPFYKYLKTLNLYQYYPTQCHYLLKLLEKKNLLTRIYTQNIDMLECFAGINDKYIVECHGSLKKSTCVECGKEYNTEDIIDDLNNNSNKEYIPICNKTKNCNGYIKPNIVFYGQELPKRFVWLNQIDLMACELLIVIGTSLNVEPVSTMIYKCNDLCIRMLWNNELVFPFSTVSNNPDNYRDVVCLGECDKIAYNFAKEMGWEKELMTLQLKGNNKLNELYHPDKLNKGLNRIQSSFSNLLSYFSPKDSSTEDEIYKSFSAK